MRCALRIIILAAMAAFSSADIFTVSLGDMAQYSASLVRLSSGVQAPRPLITMQTATPTLTGSIMLFTKAASPKDGLDVVLSDELRSSVQNAVDSNCQDVNTQCVESIKYLLINRNTKLESRQVGPEVIAGAVLAGFLGILYALLGKSQSEQAIPIAIHVPSVQLNPAVSAARAPTFAAITKSDSPILTITPTPVAATITGPNKPTYTFLSKEQDRGPYSPPTKLPRTHAPPCLVPSLAMPNPASLSTAQPNL